MERLAIYTNSNEALTYFNDMAFEYMDYHMLEVGPPEDKDTLNVLILDTEQQLEKSISIKEYGYVIVFGKEDFNLEVKYDLFLADVDAVKGFVKFLYYFISCNSFHFIGTELKDMLGALEDTNVAFHEIGHGENCTSQAVDILTELLKEENLKGIWIVEKLESEDQKSLMEIFDTVDILEDLLEKHNQADTSAFYFPFSNDEKNNDEKEWIYIFTGK